MKRILAISCLFVFLCANTELYQLLKLPVLFHHYLEDHHSTFTEFLYEHYNNNQTHSDNHHHDHQNLPFKTTGCGTTHTTLAFNNQNNLSLCRLNDGSEKIISIYKEVIYSSSIFNKVWQPPQFS
ncbi:MAG: hypothetical protein IPP77_08015 [Bacteroidetes bacterium]|nr:hypothetical protein [Bacteroidota bacterium]